MSDGEWRIWQNDTGGRTKCDVIPIHQDGELTTPGVIVGDAHIEVRYRDGSKTFYPWANIVRAEYDPPTNP